MSSITFSQHELEQLSEIANGYDQISLDYGRQNLSTRFSLNEYNRRRRILRETLKNEGVEFALLASPESQCWLHGYQSRWYRTGTSTEWPPTNFTAVSTHSEELILFDTREHTMLIDSTVFFEKSAGSSPSGVTFVPLETVTKGDKGLDNIYGFIIEHLKEKGWINSAGGCGLELWSPRLNTATTSHLIAKLADLGSSTKDISRAVRMLQVRKSEEEIRVMREAGEILDGAFEHLKSPNLRWARIEEPLKPITSKLNKDMTEVQVWAEMEWAMAQLGNESSGLHNTVSGTRKFCHTLSGSRTLGEGPLLLDPCAVKYRYHTNTARQFFLGKKPPRELVKASLVAGNAVKVLNSISKEGMRFSELNILLRSYYQEAGLWEQRDWIGGYQLGISFAPDWVGEFNWNVDTEGDDAETDKIIREGMVTNFESFVLGAGIIDTIVFKKSGVEVLSKLPPYLYLVEEERYINEDDLM